jgi:hypothetical protein
VDNDHPDRDRYQELILLGKITWIAHQLNCLTVLADFKKKLVYPRIGALALRNLNVCMD